VANVTRWHKIRQDHCAPDRPDALAAWRERGADLVGLTTYEVQEALSPWGERESCPIGVARFLRHVVCDWNLHEPPDGWPAGYCEPGPACPDVAARPVKQPHTPEPNRGRVQVQRKAGKGPHTLEVSAKGQGLVKNVDDLARVSELDLDEWRVLDHSVNTWTTPIKGDDGHPSIVRNWQVKARLERRMVDGATWATRYSGPPLPRQAPEVEPDHRTALLVPDSQHGFRWGPNRRDLLPMHDMAACDAVLQVAQRMQPDDIVLLGDMLDLAEWSTKYPRPMDLRDTSQASIDALHYWLAELRVACPAARIIYLEGNHEDRIKRLLVERAAHAADLHAVGDDRPALSVPRLLALDDLGIEYVEPYGEAYYLSPRVMVHHGDKVRSGGGATTQAVVKEARVSTGFGHVHRVSIAHRTVYDEQGARVLTAATPGCLCDTRRTPAAASRLDWQQGYGVVHYGPGYDHWSVHTIQNGRTFLEGAPIYGEARAEQVGNALGIPIRA